MIDEKTLAVSRSEFDQYGCVNCGCGFCHSNSGVYGNGSADVKCGECGTIFIILADGIEQSRMGYGTDQAGIYIYPNRKPHPRLGIPKHQFVRPDIRPETGGEFWSPRGIGYDLSGFVKSNKLERELLKCLKMFLVKNLEHG
jgi:ribosomal protein S27E